MSAKKLRTPKTNKPAAAKKPASAAAPAASGSARPYADIPIDLPTVTAAEKKRALQLADALAATSRKPPPTPITPVRIPMPSPAVKV